MEVTANSVVVPGDTVGTVGKQELRIGPGLAQIGQSIVATKAGVLRYKDKHKYYWIDSNQKRYVPALEDLVIGVIVDQMKDFYSVDLGCSHYGLLPILAFEGATKRTRPNLQVNSLVYARVKLASPDRDPELECMSVRQKTDGFGELCGGYMTKCSLQVCRQLLDPDCEVIRVLGERYPYEIAVGLNGRVWVASVSAAHAILIANVVTTFAFETELSLQPILAEMAIHLGS
ncbi:Exosome component 3 [Pelomyxa schiedti]|nr:Exosome component 3 [Pelomyxa schiedti]